MVSTELVFELVFQVFDAEIFFKPSDELRHDANEFVLHHLGEKEKYTVDDLKRLMAELLLRF